MVSSSQPGSVGAQYPSVSSCNDTLPCPTTPSPHSKKSDITLASPENLHSARSRATESSEASLVSHINRKPPIKWPKMAKSEDTTWSNYQKAVLDDLPKHWVQPLQKLKLLETTAYGIAVERFGTIEPKKKVPFISRRQKQIREVRAQLNQLKKAWLATSDDAEKDGLTLLQDEHRVTLRALRKAECSRKRRWRRRNARRRFYLDPFSAAREVLSPRCSVEPVFSQEELDEYLTSTTGDPNKDVPLGSFDDLPAFDRVLKPFDTSKLSFKALHILTKKKRNGSLPGLNQLAYKVYKKCPGLLSYLFSIHLAVVKSRKIPLSWRLSDGFFTSKVDEPKADKIADFRLISLLNVEGKLFWTLVSNRLYSHLVTENKIINTSSQKGSIKKMAGVWEHTAMMWSGLQDARKRRKNITTIWLDLANAFGSVPHSLIEFVLTRYGIPPDWIELIMLYYHGMWGRVSTSKSHSHWIKLECGIFAGCTVSVIIFLAAFNIFLEYLDSIPVPRYTLSSGVDLPLLRAFVDDLNITTISVPNGQTILDAVDRILTWARMKAKASKSRSGVVVKGRCLDISPFFVGSERIPSLQDKPVKSLGRVLDEEG